MAFGNAMVSDKFDDNTLDNPQEAFTQLKANADVYNAFRLLMKACAGLDIGDGLKDDLAGKLAVALASDAGLEIVTNLLKIKLQTDSGLQRVAAGMKVDIGSLTVDGSPDLSADYVMTLDDTDGKLKKVLGNLIAPALGADSVTQTEIANAAVGQGELKSTTGDMSTGTRAVLITGPGGEYGFWPIVKSTAGEEAHVLAPLAAQKADNTEFTSNVGASFFQRFVLGKSAGGTITARQRYVQASPPYDLGDGQVGAFIFALIDNATGDPLAMYHAPDPPWANNGPTNIRPDRIDIETGKRFKRIPSGNKKVKDILTPGDRAKLINGTLKVKSELFSEVELTNEFKNSDMGLIPHPFLGNSLSGKTIVLIDPVSKFVERMAEMQEDGETPIEIFSDYVRIDNQKLSRQGPQGVDIVAAKLK